MFNLAKQKKISLIAIIILTLLFLLAAFWQVFFGAVLNQETVDLSLTQYQNATARLSKLEDSYKNSIFNNQLFINLKSIFRLPLEVGAIGKENPFLLPLPPEVKKPGS